MSDALLAESIVDLHIVNVRIRFTFKLSVNDRLQSDEEELSRDAAPVDAGFPNETDDKSASDTVVVQDVVLLQDVVDERLRSTIKGPFVYPVHRESNPIFQIFRIF